MAVSLTAISVHGAQEAYRVSNSHGTLGVIERAPYSKQWTVVACTRLGAVGKHIGDATSKDSAALMLASRFEQ